MAKPDRETIIRAILRAALRLLPAGALFLPLCTLETKVLFRTNTTAFNVVGLLGALLNPEQTSALVNRIMMDDNLTTTRAWAYAAMAGLAVSAVFMLAGFAFLFAIKSKPLFVCAVIHLTAALGGITALLGATMASRALAGVVRSIASLTVNRGAWILAAALLLNLIACTIEWLAAKKRERLTELVHSPKKKKE